MARLEELIAGAQVAGILPDTSVSVVTVQWFGSDALELTYKDPAGRVANQLLYRHDEARLSWSRRVARGASTGTVPFSGSSPRHTASGWLTSSTLSSPSTP